MFHDAVITMKGLILDTKIRSGQAVPKFTRMKIGHGVYDGTEEISESESLKSLRQEFGFSSIEIVDNKTVRLRAISDNEGITDGYYISELGVFAEDPDEGEILYSIAIGVENKMDYQPSEAELPGATCTFDTYTSVSNIETATIMVDLGAAASAKDLDDVMHPEFEDYSEEEAEVPDTSTAIGGIQSKKSIFDVFSFMKAAILGLNRDKVDASGGDIANTTVSEFSKETGEFPDLNPGEAPKTLWGKMKKFVEDFRAWYTGVCLIGHIVNNCTSGATNLPLSALQGKVLMDLYTKLNSDLVVAHAVFAPASGIGIFYNNNIYRFGRIVCYNFQTPPVNLMGGENYVIATVPEGFRPIERAIGMVLQENGNPIAYNVHPDGNVTIYGNIDNKIIVISGSYIAADN